MKRAAVDLLQCVNRVSVSVFILVIFTVNIVAEIRSFHCKLWSPACRCLLHFYFFLLLEDFTGENLKLTFEAQVESSLGGVQSGVLLFLRHCHVCVKRWKHLRLVRESAAYILVIDNLCWKGWQWHLVDKRGVAHKQCFLTQSLQQQKRSGWCMDSFSFIVCS